MDNIWINDEAPKKIEKIIADGEDELFLVSDFDRTLTKAYHHGKSNTALVSQLYQANILPDHLKDKPSELYNKYYPLEMDTTLDKTEKTKAMEEWWQKTFEVLIEAGLSRTQIREAVSKSEVELRTGGDYFFNILYQLSIPLIIISANVLGRGSIRIFLRKQDVFYPNIHLVTNQFIWDENEIAIDYRKHFIHTTNKNFFMVPSDVTNKIIDRSNVILLGDTLEDNTMTNGLENKNILKIGFYNNPELDGFAHYQEKYDVLILRDGPMDFINDILSKLSKE